MSTLRLDLEPNKILKHLNVSKNGKSIIRIIMRVLSLRTRVWKVDGRGGEVWVGEGGDLCVCAGGRLRGKGSSYLVWVGGREGAGEA